LKCELWEVPIKYVYGGSIMKFSFTIQRKLITFSLIALIFTSVVGAVGYGAARNLGNAKDEIMHNATAIKLQLQADQARSAVYADVLTAILAGSKKDMQEIADIKKDAEDHSNSFLEAVNNLEATDVNDNIKQEMAKMRPYMGVYLESATTFIGLASTDIDAALTRFPEFSTAFRSLGVEMGLLSNLIEDSSHQTQSHASTDFAKIVILVVTLSAWIILLVIGFFVGRSIIFPLNDAITIARHVADGDLTSHIEVKTKDETGQLLQALRDMNTSLVGIVGEVRHTTDSITTAAKEIAAGNGDLSQRTEEQASSLEETASSMEELTSTVKQNAENARQANQLAANASDIAVKGGQAVGEVIETMASISTSSKKIVDIISVIESIAFQTNILALNAAVEAARAGEQGRGFAVVASEVRNLAQRSAAAAKEIKSLIDDSVEKVGAGSRQVDQAGATMEEIVSAVKRVTDIMSEIAAASNEQSAGIEQVNQAIIQMDEVTQQNAALVEQAAAAAEAMQEQAATLMEAVGIFKLEENRVGMETMATPSNRMPASVREEKALSDTPKVRKRIHAKETSDGEWKEF
jgi:methyl-accepting chemotaxis protein